MSNDLATQEIFIIRLPDGDTPAAFQTRVEAQAGPIAGERLSWLDGPWRHLSGG